MATLAETFLQDLEDLELEGEPAVEVKEEKEECAIPDALWVYDMNQETIAIVVTDLTRKPQFVETMAKVRQMNEDMEGGHIERSEMGKSINPDELALVEVCNEFVGTIDNEILHVHKFIKDIYDKRFPELDSIVFTPLEYIAVVKRIQNRIDLSSLDLTDILPNNQIMAVTVAISTSTGASLPQNELQTVIGAADEAMQLADCRNSVLLFLESRMSLLAPNLSVLLSSALTARLLTLSGGLENLARMPSQNIMHVGTQKRSSMSISTATHQLTQGVICQSEIVIQTPLEYRTRAIKLLSGKCGLAARIDSFKECPDGSAGKALRDQIILALLKSQEPPPAPLKKSLPIPDEKPKRRRGGKKYRRMKEKYGLTEVRKAANRMEFGEEPEETYGLEEEGGFGLLGRTGSMGKLKIQAKKSKVQIPKKKQAQLMSKGITTTSGGITSSLAFTPVQGIELVEPKNILGRGNPTNLYFASSKTFQT